MTTLKPATLYDLLQRDAIGTYQRWTTSLTALRGVTDKASQSIYTTDLEDLYAKAQELLDTDQLDGKTQPMMKIILSRPLEQWLVLNRHPNSPLVPTY